ncbi:ATPase P [Oscillibacter sp.]|uniref:ATPase P n=1 Tax=Oscillibacter sp. TaxID=1945593 RepID=UPI002D7F5A95|nr:ATPase P [Oscillibacter sp.]
MIIKPIPLGRETLDQTELLEDRKSCCRFGPCGVGRKALYLNSFYLDCRYYLPFAGIGRVFKRVAMSSGGFSHRGVFASIPYLVVEYDGGKQKQCNFKYEDQVDQMLEYLSKARPSLPLHSAEAEERLARRERERAAQVLPELSEEARRSVKLLQKAEVFLEARPDLTGELSRSAREKRAYLRSKPSYRYVALAVMAAGLLALVYGLYALTKGADTALYFLLFGLAALFMFSGANVLPTSRNNRKAVMGRAEQAQRNMETYLQEFPKFPLPPRYAHPVVLRRMHRAIEEGRAETSGEALETVKRDLKALNSSVEVDQEEYNEVVEIKPMFLNEDYQ